MSANALSTSCCIVGAGPCGLMLGFLLGRAGVDVTVLEKHGDFLHDFRGDIIHPSTLEVIAELGLLEEFLELPHQKEEVITEQFGSREYTWVDYRHLPTRAKFLAMMPQWDFLDFLAKRGRKYPCFRLLMRTEGVGLLADGDRVAGARARTPEGPIEIGADLTVACDGRGSLIRACAGLVPKELGAPMDSLWFRMPKRANDPPKTTSRLEAGRSIILLDRGDYWQCAFLIVKGSIEEVQRAGLPALRRDIARLVPSFADRVEELADWSELNLLSTAVNRLERWYRPGLLCIGDAAHAMSPVLGVGVSLAVQDAVAAANILWRPLTMRNLRESDLRSVQRRRQFPIWATQQVQLTLHRSIDRLLHAEGPLEAPLPVRMLGRFPRLRRIPARLMGMGFRPEHVRTPEVEVAPGLAGRLPEAAQAASSGPQAIGG
ncbi:MAG TPA: FAD-dependent oxidoreductase [Xanthobacteraceae bacterium]|jgi:2-polyprenyl-6-methoxyphenol hydroxylase-like FAD-dependent oxidoreductase